MFNFILALHIIFIVTWFSGLFYVVRLFIYNREAQDMEEPERAILHQQYNLMIRRLWLGITWPSAILTLIFGPWVAILYVQGNIPGWLWTKLAFVLGLYLYHFSLHRIYLRQKKGIFKYTSSQLRIWNEVATLFLFAIVFLVVLKSSLNMVKGLIALILLAFILVIAIRIYRKIREKRGE